MIHRGVQELLHPAAHIIRRGVDAAAANGGQRVVTRTGTFFRNHQPLALIRRRGKSGVFHAQRARYQLLEQRRVRHASRFRQRIAQQIKAQIGVGGLGARRGL